MEVYSAGTLKVSKRIWAAVSRFARGFRGGSVRRTGCCCHEEPQSAILRQQSLVYKPDDLLRAAYLLTQSL